MKNINLSLRATMLSLRAEGEAISRLLRHFVPRNDVLVHTRNNIALVFTFAFFALYFAFSSDAAFQDSGISPRADALGGAYTAIADDGATYFYNPAGLGRLVKRELFLQYSRLYIGLTDESKIFDGAIYYTHPIPAGLGVLSLGWAGRGVVSSYQEEEFHFGYGIKVMNNFVLPLAVFEITFGEINLGVNFKRLSVSLEKNQWTEINSALVKFYDSAFAVDAGILFKPSDRFSFGAGFLNANSPSLTFTGDSNPVPLSIRTGFAYRLGAKADTIFASDVSFRSSFYKIKIGLEHFLLGNNIALRVGTGFGNYNFWDVTTGVGIYWNQNSYGEIGIDYAFIYPLSGIKSLYGTHKFGIVFK